MAALLKRQRDEELLYLPLARIAVQQENPKKRGSKSFERYERYKSARTVQQFYGCGGLKDDLRFDLYRDFVTVLSSPPDGTVESDDDEQQNDDDDDDDERRNDDERRDARNRARNEGGTETNGGAMFSSDSDSDSDDDVDARELSHMLLFFMCQLRWQFGLIVEPRRRRGSQQQTTEDAEFFPEAFDAELERLGFDWSDLERCAPQMEKFFEGPAKGDRWVPWHCAVCEQELFLFEELLPLTSLSAEQKYAAGTAFSASRWVPLWREAILPNLIRPDVDVARRPAEAFQKGSQIHEAMVEWRGRGHKLHTASFNCYPPRGASGAKFTDFIAQRHADFAALGVRAFQLIQQRQNKISMADLDAVFRAQPRVGPTMSKVLLVTTHLWYPRLGILDGCCQVGDGAAAAFDFLFRRKTHNTTAAHKLQRVFDLLVDKLDALEPRFNPMLAFLARHTRAAFPSIPAPSLADALTVYDLQVCLCEWRKFRKNVDKRKSILLPGSRRRP